MGMRSTSDGLIDGGIVAVFIGQLDMDGHGSTREAIVDLLTPARQERRDDLSCSGLERHMAGTAGRMMSGTPLTRTRIGCKRMDP